MKKRLLINFLSFELLNTTVYNEYGDEFPVHITFTADRLSGVLTITDFDADGVAQSITLEKKEMTRLLRWVIHTLEIFMWEEDYSLAPDDFSDVPYLDLLPEYWPDNWDDEDEDEVENQPEQPDTEPEAEIFWRVRLEYADSPDQEIVSYRDYLYDKPDELFWTLMEYFSPESDDDFDGDDC